MAKKLIIPWDLGATKCAVAVMEYDDVTQNIHYVKHHATMLTEHKSLLNLIQHFEINLDIKMSDADAICIGAAGIYDGEQLRLESGYPFAMNFGVVAKNLNWKKYCVVHDYAPILCATFTDYVKDSKNIKFLNKANINLYSKQLDFVQGANEVSKRSVHGVVHEHCERVCNTAENSSAKSIYGRKVALGIGTGLGVKDGVLLPNGDFWLGNNEMGHIGISIPPLTTDDDFNRHQEFIKFLTKENILNLNEPLTFEKILSGKGAVRIHQFMSNCLDSTTPEEIGELMRSGHANETYALFAWYLGLFVGTVELTFMPNGGTWITGGVALKHLEVFDDPNFYRGITASPSYLEERKSFSLAVMCDNRHAFYGGTYYAVKRLLSDNTIS